MKLHFSFFLVSCLVVLSISAPLEDNNESFYKRDNICGRFTKTKYDTYKSSFTPDANFPGKFSGGVLVEASKPGQPNTYQDVLINVEIVSASYQITTQFNKDGWTPVDIHSLAIIPVLKKGGNNLGEAGVVGLSSGVTYCNKAIIFNAGDIDTFIVAKA